MGEARHSTNGESTMSDERLIRQLQKALSEAEMVRAEVAAEREACAVLVESDRLHGNDRLAAAIRQRGAK